MKHILLILFLFFTCKCFSQRDTLTTSDSLNITIDSTFTNDSVWNKYYSKTQLSIITGYELQQNHFLELGFGIKEHGIAGPHPFTLIYSLTNEFKIKPNDFIWGQKIGIWAGDGCNIGLNLIHYTNFNKSTFRFRPEIGMGYDVLRLVYGYNSALINKNFEGINKHNFTLNLTLGFKTVKVTEK